MILRLLLLLFLAFATRAFTVDVSILDFQRKPSALKKVSKDEADYFTGRVRKVAAQTDRSWRVMSRENIQKILEENGKDYKECLSNAEGKCEVAIGELLQADYHVVGDLSVVGGKIVLSARVYDVKTSALKGSEDASAPTVSALMDKVDGLARSLFQQLSGASGVISTISSPNMSEKRGMDVGSVITTIVVDGGAGVTIDGRDECSGHEICQRPLSRGNHSILVSRQGYRDTVFSIDVPTKDNRYQVAMQQKMGRLDLHVKSKTTGNDLAAKVYLNGEMIGKAPGVISVPMSGSTLVLKMAGYQDAVVIERPTVEGSTTEVIIKMEPETNEEIKFKAFGENTIRIDGYGCLVSHMPNHLWDEC